MRDTPSVAAPDRIRAWVENQFQPRQVDRVTQDLIDVATGNRPGNKFEKQALTKIFPQWSKPCES